MKKNVEIKKLGINGEGIGYIDRKIVFVPGALPQEEVIVEIIKQTRTYSEGELLQVVKPSKDRVTPKCRSYDNCQGVYDVAFKLFQAVECKKRSCTRIN